LAAMQQRFSDWTRHQQNLTYEVTNAPARAATKNVGLYSSRHMVSSPGSAPLVVKSYWLRLVKYKAAMYPLRRQEKCIEALDAGKSSGNCCCTMSWRPRERLLVTSRVVIDMRVLQKNDWLASCRVNGARREILDWRRRRSKGH
jgi:hypothetical protein